MCCWTAVLSLVYLTTNKESINYRPVLYQNSGDIPLYGDKSRVVGYQSVVVTKKKPGDNRGIHLTEEEQKHLFQIARDSISAKLSIQDSDSLDENEISDSLQQHYGVFVSIYYKNDLRGCIGRIETSDPLYQSVQSIAVSAAFNDTRFKSITKDEIQDVSIEISVLTPLKKISSIEEIIPGKHGILIRKDYRSGTYLPQVATKTGWNAKELVEHCAREKAGINDGEWKDADIYTYEALIFSDNE
ncbi:hypothetical protein ES705_41255 [subsurface metagenome]